MYGTTHGIAFDDERYYVSALLHDRSLPTALEGHPDIRPRTSPIGSFSVASLEHGPVAYAGAGTAAM
jgi:hypothetical protein